MRNVAILGGVSPAATLLEALEPLRSDPMHSAVLLDIDGTLAPIVRHAEDAHVPEATRTLLIEIAKRYGVVGCISGRRAGTARQIVAIGSIAYIGNHGGELLRPGATSVIVAPELAEWTERVQRFAKSAYTQERMRLRIRMEDKGAIVALHWRGVPDEQAAEQAVAELAATAESEGFAVHWGRKVLEVRPPVSFDKSVGIEQLLHQDPEGSAEPLSGAVYVGDDVTDLDAFRGLREIAGRGELRTAVCVAVTSEEAPPELVEQADVTVDGQSGVRGLLEALL
jgi:trehalose 6-phosphate phosphatase